MTKTACKFDMSYFAAAKSEEDRRTLNEYGYRTLTGEEALECIKGLEGLTVGDRKIETIPLILAEGRAELRYYREGARDIKALNESGNSIWVYLKDGGKELFPIRLRSEKEVKELPSISEIEERRKSTK